MPQWLRDLFAFLQSAPLTAFWYLFGGAIIGVYIMALILVHAIPAQTTIIHRARRAWGLAFLVHAAVSVVIMLNWYFGNRMLVNFWSFAPFYIVLFIFDLLAGVGLNFSAKRFQRYGE